MGTYLRFSNSIFILSLFWCANGYAQYKRVPDVNKERNEVNQQILKGHYKGTKLYELELFPDKALDTVMYSDFSYYPSGRLKEFKGYSYTKWEEVKELEYWRKLGRYQQGAAVSFSYDGKGNMVAKRSTILYPHNSYMAMMAIAMKPEVKQGLDPDSLLAVGVPEQAMAREVLTYKYDKDGNPVSSFDSVTGATTVYRYKYDGAKRVTVQRQTTYESDKQRPKTVSEFHFGYDKAGNLDSIMAYRSFMDTVNVVIARNRQYMVGRVYNEKGKVIREYTSSQSTDPAETVFMFDDTLNMGSVTIKKFTNDTDAITENRYDDKKRPIEEKRTVFNRGIRYSYNRKEFTYDDADNVTEIRYYSREAAATKEQMNKRNVFIFY